MAGGALARILSDIRQRGGLQGRDIANILGASPATVSRWSNGKASPTLPMQAIIADLRYVIDRLSDFYDAEGARLWLHSRHPLLNQERAIDLIQSGKTEDVLRVIERLEEGAYL